MTPSIVITLTLLAAAASTVVGRDRRYELIAERPYNNQYNDASAAKDERAFALRRRIA